MMKQALPRLLVVTLIVVEISLLLPVRQLSAAVDQWDESAKIRAKVFQLKGQKVRVLLVSGRSLEGFILEVNDESFVIGHRTQSQSPSVRFDEVSEIESLKRKFRLPWWTVPVVVIGGYLVVLAIAPKT